MSVREPFEDLRDDGFLTDPSSEFFDFRRLLLAPAGGMSCDEGDSPPLLELRRGRRCRELPVEDSWAEDSMEGSEERCWRRVLFCLGASPSLSKDWARALGMFWLRFFERFEVFSRSPEFKYVK
ncbi:unnamed protein product [Sphenostylis stenocarpa]|uniref:Uncharacterized protein n=1 Tax=Sphenostylis stenocarpa TaxID=92480 RepID=A0AA86SMS4_9FABA|nr:unnamed protein product [Sphenostylis stenocarpa]